MKHLFISFIALATVFLSGCVTPLTVENSAIQVPLSAKEKVAVVTIENRPYVLSGKKTDRFEGIMRGSYGIPINLNNIEKKKFTDYIGDRVAQGFSNAGYTVTKLSLGHGATDAEVRDKIIEAHSDRGFAVRLDDWRIDWGGFIVPSWQFFYAVDISVYDGSGTLLCRRTFSGRDVPLVEGKDSIFNNSVKHYQFKFKEFLNDRRIVDALRGIKDHEAESSSHVKDRLAELQSLLESGLVTDGEYAEKKKQLLDKL